MTIPNLTAARAARASSHLAGLIRTTEYGIVTRKARIERAVADGASFAIVSVYDESRERALLREIALMQRGRGVPTGNANHPLTIKLRELQAELAAGPRKPEYHLHPDHAKAGRVDSLGRVETWFSILTKTEFDFAVSLGAVVALGCEMVGGRL